MTTSDILSGLAIIVSVLVGWRQRRADTKLTALDLELRTYQLQAAEDDRTRRQSAELNAYVFPDEDESRSADLFIENQGEAMAVDLTIKPWYPKAPGFAAFDEDVVDRLTVERLRPGGHWIIPLRFLPEVVAPPLRVKLGWRDGPTGTAREDEIDCGW